METQLIVTADDFGYSDVRDDGILKCWEARRICRTSLLINGVSAKSACLKAKKANLKVGEY